MTMAGRIFVGIAGVILLLPGTCSLAFMLMFGLGGSGGGEGGMLWILWLITYLVAWGGVVLLRKVWRNS